MGMFVFVLCALILKPLTSEEEEEVCVVLLSDGFVLGYISRSGCQLGASGTVGRRWEYLDGT